MALIDDLIAYWKLDEASGSRADSHGSYTLTDNNTVASATGKINDGADLESGNSEYLSNSSMPIHAATSVSFWYKAESDTGNIQVPYAHDGRMGGTESVYFNFHVNSGLSLAFYMSGSGGNIGADPIPSSTISTGTWYHFVITYDSTNGLVIYRDGSSLYTTGSVGTRAGSTAQPFRIGVDGFGRYTDGIVDEVGYWSRELTSAEVTSLYNSGNGFAYPFASGYEPGQGALSLAALQHNMNFTINMPDEP